MQFNDHHRQLAIFEDVITTNRGLIIHPKTCEFVYTGGCVYMISETSFRMPFDSSVKVFDRVITLTAPASGTWHFPMELFVSLTGVSPDLITDDTVFFHLPRNAFFIRDWMKLLKISKDRLIFDPIIQAKVLYAPEPGRCGEIYESQLAWLNQRFNPFPEEERKISQTREILHLIRTSSRVVRNDHLVTTLIKDFARKHNYTYTAHIDRDLPSLSDQIRIFSRAPIVIGSHGAGLLFTAFSPSNACILEYMPPNNPECYSRISFMKRLNYEMFMMDNNTMNITQVEESLLRCHNHFESTVGKHVPP
eukprot:gene12163-13301_t